MIVSVNAKKEEVERRKMKKKSRKKRDNLSLSFPKERHELLPK
jgi:hypothetical protein